MLKIQVGIAAATLALCTIAIAQTKKPAPDPQLSNRGSEAKPSTYVGTVEDLGAAQNYIAREFGPGYKLAKDMPVMVGDLDGDGKEDVVMVVTGGSPLLSAGAFNYTVIDPYDGYWSFSDPNLNAHLPQMEPGPKYYLLLAHDWKGETAKMKFVMMNLPFKQISLTPTAMGGPKAKKGKKTIVAAISTVERDGQQGAVFWNGKEYKFVQLGNTEE